MTNPSQHLPSPLFRSVTWTALSILGLAGGMVWGQGYQVQGPSPDGAGASAFQSAPINYSPAPAAGLGQFGSAQPMLQSPVRAPQQPSWQTASPYAMQPRPAPMTSAPKRQYRSQVQPNVAPMPPQYAPMAGGFGQQPMPYPEFAAPAPKNKGEGGAAIRAEIEHLKSNDARQDARLASLESSIAGGRAPQHEGGVSSLRHRVEMGESLWTIASDHGISADELKRMNHRTSDVVMPGELLTVPGSRRKTSGGLTSSPKLAKTSSSDASVHVVQRGESLSEIAAAYKTSLSSLQTTNKIRNANLISPGQRLVIPGRAGSARAVKTQPVRSQSLASAPPRTSPKVTKTKSRAPSVAISPSVPEPGTIQQASKNTPRSVVSYRVEGGDSIEAVARNFNTTPGEIQRINKLPATRLPAVGEEIIVPLPSLVSL